MPASRDDAPLVTRRRTNPGRVIVFQQAWVVTKESAPDLLQLWAGLLVAAALVNLPWWPAYVRGLMTGAILTAGVGLSLWLVWYGVSDLGPRLEGTWAEQWTADELKKAPSVLETIPNVRFERFDVDNVVITRDGVYLLEVKRHRRFYPGLLESDLAQFALDSRTARNFLSRSIRVPEAPRPELITSVLVVWGKAGVDLFPTELTSSTGDVIVVGGQHLRALLETRPTGYLGPDYARELAKAIRAIAVERELLNQPPSRVVRWLARTR